MLTDKKLAKIEGVLGKDKMQSLEGGQVEELQVTIANAAAAIRQAEDELEANPKYQALKDGLADVSAALKDCRKFQNAVIQYCLSLIEDKGK